jgi:type VI protein secretion system component VasF
MGAYRQPGGPEQLDLLIGDLRREAFKAPKTLSIHGNRPSEAGPGRRRLPLMPIAAVSLAVTVVAIIVMYFLLSSTLSEAVDTLTQMGRG